MSEANPNTAETNGFENKPAETSCRNCGAPVTKQFARVFGDNRHRVFACLNCSDKKNVSADAKAGTGQ